MAHGFPLPDLDLTGSAEVVGGGAFCINLAAAGKPITSYNVFRFTSLGQFNDVKIGTYSDGVYSLFDADTDGGEYTETWFEFYTDLGTPGIKKIRGIRIHGVASGQIELRTEHDDSEEYRRYLITPDYLCDRHEFKVTVGKEERGTYWRLAFYGIAGAKFSIDKIFVRYVKVIG